MECDGMKQALLVDIDGSLIGNPGAILPEAEFEWDGDARRGLGDYRYGIERESEREREREKQV